VQAPFTGTETGTVTDIFIPTMMVKNNGIERSDYEWFRTFVKLEPGSSQGPVRDRLAAVFHGYLREYAKTFQTGTQREISAYVRQKLSMDSASAGVSRLQADYGHSLVVLGVLVSFILAIACLNVANLMTLKAAARSREMALRISIGAGTRSLFQLVLMESALVSCAGALTGAVFAWCAVPVVVNMISSPAAPTRLSLVPDWRVVGFSGAITLGVIVFLTLPAALRVSALEPISALKGDALLSRNRLAYWLTALQAGFCFLVLFLGTLFITSFERLSRQPLGFSPDRVLTLETLSQTPIQAVFWEQVADRLRSQPGVEAVGLSEWPLMTGESWNNLVSVKGAPSHPLRSYFLSATQEWREVMRIPLLDGRDLRKSDRLPGSAVVNSAFVKEYFGSGSPVGKVFDMVTTEGSRRSFRVFGHVGDARSRYA
jgi:putative ABC transport system permease protein